MARNQIRVEGLDKALKALNDEIDEKRIGTRRGLITVGLLFQGKSQRKVPVDLANLKASAFTIWTPARRTDPSLETRQGGRPNFKNNSKGSDSRADKDQLAADHDRVLAEERGQFRSISPDLPEVTVGYSAFYAIFVHEDPDAQHTVGEFKFLESAVKENIPKAVKILTRIAKQGG